MSVNGETNDDLDLKSQFESVNLGLWWIIYSWMLHSSYPSEALEEMVEEIVTRDRILKMQNVVLPEAFAIIENQFKYPREDIKDLVSTLTAYRDLELDEDEDTLKYSEEASRVISLCSNQLGMLQ